MISQRVITVIADDGYLLQCRSWRAAAPRAVVIFAHGVISHSMWLSEIASDLAEQGVSCLVADRRGAGLNSKARGDAPDGQTLIQDLIAVTRLTSTDNTPLHWCGFCWGANLLVNALAQAPDTVRTLTLLAPSLFPTRRITNQVFLCGDSGSPTEKPTMPIECFTDGPAFKEFIVPDPLRLERVSPRFNTIMSEFSQGIWMKFLRIRLPTMVLLAADDEVVDNDATNRLFERLPSEPKLLDTLPGKHGIQFDSPALIVAHMLEWITLLESPPHPRLRSG